jgi:hypothetical protein
MLMFPTTEILMLLAPREVDWRVQGDNCDCYFEGQRKDEPEAAALSFSRHYRYIRCHGQDPGFHDIGRDT